jgi:hypothetical protein
LNPKKYRTFIFYTKKLKTTLQFKGMCYKTIKNQGVFFDSLCTKCEGGLRTSVIFQVVEVVSENESNQSLKAGKKLLWQLDDAWLVDDG